MKVKELIKELKKHNQNNEVFINVINDNTQDDIHSIECLSINCDADYNDTLILIQKK
tara:strand:+ start:827 stop:997 length:171 start_codon:yes stop_codon:yes gene_type:complete